MAELPPILQLTVKLCGDCILSIEILDQHSTERPLKMRRPTPTFQFLILFALSSAGFFCRSLLCLASSMKIIPRNIPSDIKKLRLESSPLTELPRGSFSNGSSLRYLWLNFNNLTVIHLQSLESLRGLKELRLQGNKLRSVPWTAFQDTPALAILDLQHNRLDVLPEHALKYLANLTYLDLSSNQLTVVSQEVFFNWPVYRRSQQADRGLEVTSNAVLALHANPWICDCRLRGFVQVVNSIGPPLILVNSYLTCLGPPALAGRFFHEVALKGCTKPLVSTPGTNLTVQMGRNVTLKCLAQSRPPPTIAWTYPLRLLRAFDVSTVRIEEDSVASELVIPSVLLADGGNYTCTANNFVGNSSIGIALRVQAPRSASSSSSSLSSSEDTPSIHMRIAKQTVYGITLEWFTTADDPAETWFTLSLGKFEAAQKDTVYISPGINTYSMDGLLPATKYEVCIALRSQPSRKGQCVVFITGSNVSELEQREKLIHIIVVVCAMVLSVPVGMYACTTETHFGYLERCYRGWPRRRRGPRCPNAATESKDSTFDSPAAGSEEGLCHGDPRGQDGGERLGLGAGESDTPNPNCQNGADLY
uniref:Ig-like domain-containing protein n=1 Tax=Ornithorhynchus anatinus TaxID=9258 RepID=F7B6Z6_ORNAN